MTPFGQWRGQFATDACQRLWLRALQARMKVAWQASSASKVWQDPPADAQHHARVPAEQRAEGGPEVVAVGKAEEEIRVADAAGLPRQDRLQ